MTRLKAKFKPVLWLVLITFFFNTVISEPVYADVPFLPAPGQLVSLTPSFSPSMIVGLKVFKDNPFKFEFIMSQGQDVPGKNPAAQKLFLKEQASRLVKYFLASLTIPEKDLWVNLSPYEKDRIIPNSFGLTEMGKEMLAQDYLLKQVTASVMYPEGKVGREFWARIYQEASKRFGTTNIPVNTFNKVWILPDAAVVHENAANNTAVIIKSRLKVMLEEDYLALNKNVSLRGAEGDAAISERTTNNTHNLASNIIREIILPEITKEVNEGKNFAQLRQVYNSLILAFWFKNKLKQSLIAKGYVDRRKINGVDVDDKNVDQEIYQQYIRSYKKGVYNYIKEEVGPDNEVTPRKYFSGGIIWNNIDVETLKGPDSAQRALEVLESGPVSVIPVGLSEKIGNRWLDLAKITGPSIASQEDFKKNVVNLTGSISNAVGGLNSNAAQLTNAAMASPFRSKVMGLTLAVGLVIGALLPSTAKGVTNQFDGDQQHARQQKPAVQQVVEAPPNHHYTGSIPVPHGFPMAVSPGSVKPAAPFVAPTAPQAVTQAAPQAAPVQAGASYNHHQYGNNPPAAKVTSAPFVAPTAPSTTIVTAPTVTPIAAPVQIVENVVTAPQAPVVSPVNQIEAAVPSAQSTSSADALTRVQTQIDNMTAQKTMDEAAPLKLQEQIDQMQKINVGPVNTKVIENDIANLNAQLVFNQKFANAPMDKVDLPVHLATVFNYNYYPWLSYSLTDPNKSTALVLNLNYPGSRVVEGYNIASGLASGTTDTLGEVLGPVRLVEIAMEYDNQFKAQGVEGQNKEYDLDKTLAIRVWDTLFPWRSVHVTSANQNGEKQEYKDWDSSWFHNFGVLISLPGKALPDNWRIRYIFPDPDGSFTFQKTGIVQEADRYNKAFNYLAAQKRDGQRIYYFREYHRLKDTHDPYQDPNEEFTVNSNGAFNRVKKGSLKDPYVRGWGNDFVISVDANNVATVYRFDSFPVFVNNEMMQKISGNKDATTNNTVIQPVLSNEEIERGIAFQKSLIVDGNSGVVGVRRDAISNAILKDGVIKADDVKKADTVQDTSVDENGIVRFKDANNAPMPSLHPAVPVEEPSVGKKILGVVEAEVTTPIHEVKDMFFVEPSVGTIASKFDITSKAKDIIHRPIVNEFPEGVADRISKGDIFEGGKELQQVEIKMNDPSNAGVIRRFDTWKSQPVETTDDLKDTFWLMKNNDLPSNVSINGGKFEVTVNNHKFNIPVGALVKVEDNRVVGVFEANTKTMEDWITKAKENAVLLNGLINGLSQYGVAYDNNGNPRILDKPAEDFYPAHAFGDKFIGQSFGVAAPDGKAPGVITGDTLVRVETVKGADGVEKKIVVEILEAGKRTIEDHQVVLDTIKNGFEVEDQRTIDPVTGKAVFTVFTKGNVLTVQQIAFNSTHLQQIHLESELARLLAGNQVIQVPVEGSDQKRFVILEKAPESQLKLSENEQATPAVVPIVKADTLTGPDGETFHGVTLDADVVKLSDIPKLNSLGATAVRTYLPLDIRIAQQMVAQSKVKTIIVGIPLNSKAYDPENLSSFWGNPVPASGQRISLEGNNYIDYLKQLKSAVGDGVKIVVDLGNEVNFHPDWIAGEDLNAFFKEINGHAADIKAALGDSVTVSFTLGDKPEDFVTALKNADLVQVWGINCYRPINELQKDWLAATQQAGVVRPFYIAEAGKNSNVGQDTQANADVNAWKSAELNIGLSITLMTLQDNPNKIANDAQETYGLYDVNGNPKPVVEQVANAWGGTAQTPVVSNDTLAGVNENYALVRLYSDTPAKTTTEEANKTTLKTEHVLISDLNKLTPESAKKIVEILKVDANGNTIGRFVRVYGSGYTLWNVADLEANMKSNFLINLQDGKGAQFVSLEQLRNPVIHEAVRQAADEITMLDTDQHVTARVYLNRNINGSRIEVMQPNNTSLIFELLSFSPTNLTNAVADTRSFTDLTDPKYPNGLLHVITTDLRVANPGVVVEDVYQQVPDAKPILLYSDRFLQNDRIYFKNGHEYYSVLIDASVKNGQTVTIDGQAVENVTGIFSFESTMNSGYHVTLRDLGRNGGFAPVRFTQFADGQISVDQTGFVKLGSGLSYDGIVSDVAKSGVLNMKDVYTYKSDGQFDNRVVSFLVNGSWQLGWTLKGADIGPQPVLIGQLISNDVIARTFAKYYINGNTNLIETVKTDKQGVITRDYRILGDVLEKKIISIVQEDGVVVKIIVGLDFDPRTGEQMLSYTLTPDFQVQSLSRTMHNESSYRQLMPLGVEGTYAQFMAKHLGIEGADYWKDMERNGVSGDFVPVMVEEIPFMIATDKPGENSYKSIEPMIRPLVEAYTKANDNDRPAILTKISDTVRHYHRDINTAYYTKELGQPTYHYLSPPNDSRGRDYITQTGNDSVLNMWHLEGKGKFLPNVLPASIVVDRDTGKLKRTMVFDRHTETQFKDPQDALHTLGVNVYSVFDDGQGLQEIDFTSLGKPVSETSLYQRNRVGNGVFGVETNGETRQSFAPFAYSLPLDGTLDKDGRLTKVTLHLEYSAENGHQKIVETSLVQEPTAPGDFRVKTQTIIDGKAVPGTLYEEGVLKNYWNSLKKYSWVGTIYLGLLGVTFMIGDFIRKMRLNRVIKGLDQEDEDNTVGQAAGTPPQVGNIEYPSWSDYGFSNGAVAVATRKFEGSIVTELRKRSLDDVLSEYFKGYQIWRKQVMGIDEPFVPTIEDLWILLLRNADNDFFSSGISDGLNYFMHKAIEARTARGKDADIGGFIRKEYSRWHHIIELQQTTFQGISGRKMKHVVPTDYYFTNKDLNDLFRTKANIDWYDGLGYTLDRQPDRRGAIYEDFISSLKAKVFAAREGIEAIADDLGGNVFRMKRKVTSVPAYHDYVQFFMKVQRGEYLVSDRFTSPEISAQEADLLIDHKPLMRKTFAESGSWVGRMPMPLRMIKPLAQLLRNSYKQLTAQFLLTSTVGVYVAAYDGMMSWGAATLTVATVFIATKLFYYPLSWLLDNKVNFKSFGKPKDFWAGYAKQKLTKAQIFYRTSFWSAVVSAKIVWDALLIHYFLIPHREMIGSTYFPVISGHVLPVNFNFVLMGMLWSTSVLFLWVGNWAANYLIKPFFTYIHGSIRGLGTIKTPEDIRKLQEESVLDRLIEQKLLPRGGAGLSAEQRLNARRAIIKFAFDQHREVRNEISDEEYRMAVEEGRLDHFKIPSVQKSVAQSINALLMDMPRMPHPDDNTPISVLSPYYAEDLIYAYNNSTLPTTLDIMLNTGYTNLNYIISKAPQRWENLIERVRREGIGTEDEWQRMEALSKQKGQLGEISEQLKMQIRLWASYEGQPFARTLDGLMNIVRWYQLYLKLSFPTWTDEQIRERTNADVQILWAYQIWGNVLNATDKHPDLQLKKKDTLYLLKKYYDEYGYFIEIASLQVRNGVHVKVLSRYNPATQQIEDLIEIPNTEHSAITGEGKTSNQMHALTFLRNKFCFTIDMNQDLDPFEAMKIPIIIQEFKDKNVALVNVPEVIFTGTFSKTGKFHEVSDRTFVTSDKRHMGMIFSPMYHGHPDVWRDTAIIEHGGISAQAISEDYEAGILLGLRGEESKIVNKEYMQWKKARELSWTGTDGIWRKFAMGAGQLLLGRYADWMNRRLGPIEGLGEFYSGPHFYTLMTISPLGFFVVALNMMVGGISPFTAFPAPCVTMMMGVFWVGQALTVIGFTQMALEDGVKKAISTFARLLPLMAPFYIAHIFTYQAGFLSALAGLAFYVATGRGFNREHVDIDKLMKVYSKSHVTVPAIGLTLSAIAYSIWRNETFLLSSVTMLSFLFPSIMLFVMNPGNYPIHGVTVRQSAQLFTDNVKRGYNYLSGTFKLDVWDDKNLRKGVVDLFPESIAYSIWFAITAPVAIPGMIINKIKGRPELPGKVKADKAMTTTTPGGIDLSKTSVNADAVKGEGIQIAFDDPAMLRLLLNADGLAPIIYDVKVMTPAMAGQFVGAVN